MDIAYYATLLELVQMLKKGAWVFRPEYDKSGFRIAYVHFKPIKRIGPRRISNIQAMKEPVAIECRDVCTSARRDNYGLLTGYSDSAFEYD